MESTVTNIPSTEPETEPVTLDELMSRDPLELTNIDLDKIIAYQRAQRAKVEAGVKMPRAKPASGGEFEWVTGHEFVEGDWLGFGFS